MFDVLIAGGTVVSADSTEQLDVAIIGERIAAVAAPGLLQASSRRVIDSRGMLVMPGSIDPHTHIQIVVGGELTQDFRTSTIAAAFGGVTTIIDFAFCEEGRSLAEAVRRRREQADGVAAVDYALHGGLGYISDAIVEEMGLLVQMGIPSFKAFMVPSGEGAAIGDRDLLSVLFRARELGALLALHAETEGINTYFTQKLLAEDKTDVVYFPASRPNISEAMGIQRAIALSAETHSALYFLHVSSREGVRLIGEARAKGLAIYGETCPHYLAFDDTAYASDWERAIQFVRFPPIRSKADRTALWQGLSSGVLSAVGSDEVSAQLAMKKEKSYGKPFNQLPGGMAQIETRLPVTFSEGVSRGRLTINRLVEVMSTGPARIFGLYPRKGVIAPGSDADIVVYDPTVKKTLTNGDLHQGTDYTAFEGLELIGHPVLTMLRGKVIVENGVHVGSPGQGVFLPRSISQDVLEGPVA